jgi:DNA-binding Lrp family transcriptional regulator
MASRQDLTENDRKMLRYMTVNVRFWTASKLAPHFGLSGAEMSNRLHTLEHAGYLRRFGETPNESEPAFTLTGMGIETAVS